MASMPVFRLHDVGNGNVPMCCAVINIDLCVNLVQNYGGDMVMVV